MITGLRVTKINGKSYYMRFTWAALAEVSHKYGENPNLFDPETASFVGSAGMRGNHPEMTPEKIMVLSPPLVPFADDVQKALTWAYFGDQGIPVDGKNEKKKLTLIGLVNRFVRRLSPGSAR